MPTIVPVLRFAETGEAIGATPSTLEKTRLLAGYLATLDDADLRRACTWFSGLPYGRAERRTLSIGWAAISKAVTAVSGLDPETLSRIYREHADLGDWGATALPAAPTGQTLSLADVAGAFDRMRTARGSEARQAVLQDLLARLDRPAVRFVLKILAGELRIGLQEGIVEAAVAKAFGVPVEGVRRVHMLTGDIGETAARVRAGRLESSRLELFQPVRFMLASPVENAQEAMQRASSATVWTEEKYDGVRCQLHVGGGRCELFSRDLKETTSAFPEIVEAAGALGRDAVLDGEVLAHRGDRVLPFFDLQRRLGRKVVSDRLRREVPVVFVAFDLLMLDGASVLDLPLRERRARLEAMDMPPPFLLARRETAGDPDELDRIFAETRERGNEGLMLKNPESAYTPGRRGLAWLKLKRPLATLDCVVTAVEWGHGKRRGVLSDYTFAVRDDERLLNVGKAYSGLTDAEIATMTRHFLEHTIADHGHVRVVEPDTVVEIAFDAIQRSNRHRSGFALRFPRIVRLRDDKPPSEADTLARVAELYDRYFGREVPLSEVAEAT